MRFAGSLRRRLSLPVAAAATPLWRCVSSSSWSPTQHGTAPHNVARHAARSSTSGAAKDLLGESLSCTCCRRPYGTLGGPDKPQQTTPAFTPSTAAVAAGAKRAGSRSPTRAVIDEVSRAVSGRVIQSVQRSQPPRGSGIQPLLDFNKRWAGELALLNGDYFSTLSKQQTPQYLWIGCSDSRVPANEIVGLYPGDLFVHRNIANVVSNSDLNALAVIQYAVSCLKVEHVMVTGHYNCGGVAAALNNIRVGLADHWILHVTAVKKRFYARMMADIPRHRHLAALCELNVIVQVEHVVETQLITSLWSAQNAEEDRAGGRKAGRSPFHGQEVEIHGWIYGLADGVVRPLLSLNRHSNVQKAVADAVDALFTRYGQS